jgi:hypothetical protein
MTITSTRETTEAPAPEQVEVLIEEARRRGRRQRSAVVFAVAITMALVAALAVGISGAGSRPQRRTPPAPYSAIAIVATAKVSSSSCPLTAQAQAGLTRSSSAYPFRVLGTYLVNRQQIGRDVGYFHDVQGRHLWTMCYVTGANVSYRDSAGPIQSQRVKPDQTVHYALWLYIRPHNREFALVAGDRPYSVRIAG